MENLTKIFRQIEVAGVCDLVREKAEKAQAKYGIAKIYETMHDAFADDQVEIIVNLTRPYEHFEVTKGALEAGKHVYSEKPLGASGEEGQELIALAAQKGLQIGGAPDTFLGASIQTCRKLIDDGFIGDVLGFNASMICRVRAGHPDPAFTISLAAAPCWIWALTISLHLSTLWAE